MTPNSNSSSQEQRTHFKLEIVWLNVVLLAIFHCIAFHGFYHVINSNVKWATLLWAFVILRSSGFGVTAGAHRLWSHRTYKAKLPLRILLCFLNTVAFQNSIYDWVRDHRVHHKYVETDADPHKINRGFFFAHMGWLLVKKHPDVITKGKTIDLSDLEADPIVMFQHKYIYPLGFAIGLGMPFFVPWYFWNEVLYRAFAVVGILRYVLNLHFACLVNSVNHMWGNKPYDKHVSATDNAMVATLVLGEGWHNYHHSFPWDYKTSELGSYFGNTTTAFIDFMSKIGWAYDLKTASPTVIQTKIQE